MKTIVFIFVLMFGGPRLVWGTVAPDVLIYQGGLKRVAMSNLWGFLPADLVVDGQVGVTLSGVFLGSGAGLTNISGTGVTGLGTAAFSNASAFASSSVTNLTAGQLAILAFALTNATAFDTNGAATDVKSVILSSNYVTATITNSLGSAAFSSASAFAAAGVTNLTAGQLAIIAGALTNAYTNNTTVAGLVTGSGIGTNLTSYVMSGSSVTFSNVTYTGTLTVSNGTITGNGVGLTNIPLAGLQVIPLTNNPSALPWTNSVGIYGNAVGLTNYRAVDLNNYGASPGFVLTAVGYTSLAWSNLPPVQSTNIVTSAGTLAVASLATNYTVPLLPGEIVSTLVIRLANTNAYLTFTGTNVFDASRKVMFNGFTNTVNSSIKLNLPRYRTNSVLNLIVTNGSSLFLEFWAPDTTGTNIIVTQTGLFK